MKKSIFLAMLATLVMCTACGDKSDTTENLIGDSSSSSSSLLDSSEQDSKTEDTEDTAAKEEYDSGDSESEIISEDDSAKSQDVVITPGAWYAVSENGFGYYVFNEDGHSGTYTSADMGIGVAFDLEWADDGKVIFHMGSADDSTPAEFAVDGSGAVITWDNGQRETLSYVSWETENFMYFIDSELSEMALDFYQSSTGEDISALEVAVVSNEDGTASIQLYTNVDGHNSTAAWYTVDRITAVGVDGNGESIDLQS